MTNDEKFKLAMRAIELHRIGVRINQLPEVMSLDLSGNTICRIVRQVTGQTIREVSGAKTKGRKSMPYKDKDKKIEWNRKYREKVKRESGLKMRAIEQKKTNRRNKKPEETLQTDIVNWFRISYPKLANRLHGNAIAGMFFGHTESRGGQKVFKKDVHLLSRIKATGASKDFPDISIFVARGGYHGFFLELKTETNSPILKNGSYSNSEKFKPQLEYGLALQEEGYFWEFGVGFNHSIGLIKRYMDGKIVRDEG